MRRVNEWVWLVGAALVLMAVVTLWTAPDEEESKVQQVEKARSVLVEGVATAGVTSASSAVGDWVVPPLEAVQAMTLAFEALATNDSTVVRRAEDGQSFDVFYTDTDGSRWQLLVLNRSNYEFRENLSHVLRWNAAFENEDGTPLEDFDGLYNLRVTADYEVWDTSPDSVEVQLDLPRASHVEAVFYVIDQNGNWSGPSNVLVVRQEER